jgi:hypothetical protein
MERCYQHDKIAMHGLESSWRWRARQRHGAGGLPKPARDLSPEVANGHRRRCWWDEWSKLHLGASNAPEYQRLGRASE